MKTTAQIFTKVFSGFRKTFLGSFQPAAIQDLGSFQPVEKNVAPGL